MRTNFASSSDTGNGSRLETVRVDVNMLKTSEGVGGVVGLPLRTRGA